MNRSYHRWFSPALQRDMELLVFGHTDQVRRVLGMSGVYDIRRFVRDHYDNNVYFNNPCDYIAGEHDPDRLAALRGLDIILAVGRDDPLIASNRRLSEELWDKGVWH